ncbi:MAG: hypothetical protein RIS47_1269 [Bacteroidota bacterium]|jgi:uncharacterized protein (DUF1697 family)
MKTYIALLRGINVSGKNCVKMEQLRLLFTSLGYVNIQTYIQSGNVVFQTDAGAAYEIEGRIETQILVEMGLQVSVMVLSAKQLDFIMQQNPFLRLPHIDRDKLHVTLLSAEPLPNFVAVIDSVPYIPDEFRIVGRAIYLYCPNGYGKTKLHNNFLELRFKLKATTRNWKTITILHGISRDF